MPRLQPAERQRGDREPDEEPAMSCHLDAPMPCVGSKAGGSLSRVSVSDSGLGPDSR